MNVVLDTNIIVSVIIFGGKPRTILELVIDRMITGYISEEIINEIRETLGRKFQFSKTDIDKTESLLRDNFKLVRLTKIPVVARDKKDNHVLAICHEVTVDIFISGDKDLWSLREYKTIPILNPANFLVTLSTYEED